MSGAGAAASFGVAPRPSDNNSAEGGAAKKGDETTTQFKMRSGASASTAGHTSSQLSTQHSMLSNALRVASGIALGIAGLLQPTSEMASSRSARSNQTDQYRT